MNVRRHGLIAFCTTLLALAGCTDTSRSAIDVAKLVWRGSPKVNPSAQDVAARPYYQLLVTAKNTSALMILGNVDGDRQYWYAHNGEAIVLVHGRVEQTIGLPQNLEGSRVSSGNDPFAVGLQTLQQPLEYQRVEDWSPGYRYGLPVSARLTPSGAADVEILGTTHHLLLVTEDINGTATGFHATNRYWVDPADGFVWKSEQHVLPDLTLTFVELRPYRGGTL